MNDHNSQDTGYPKLGKSLRTGRDLVEAFSDTGDVQYFGFGECYIIIHFAIVVKWCSFCNLLNCIEIFYIFLYMLYFTIKEYLSRCRILRKYKEGKGQLYGRKGL